MEEKTPSTRLSKSVLIAAVVLAVVAVVIVNVYIRTMEDRQKRGLRVLQARRRLEQDRPLAREDVEPVEIPLPAKSVADKMVKEDELASVLDRPLIRPVSRNEHLLWSHFTPSLAELEYELPEKGYRGLTLTVDPKTSPGPLLRPGTYVDVMATVPPNQARGQSALTVTLLEGVLVLAVGGRTLHDPPAKRPNYDKITLRVTPEEAEKLASINAYLRAGIIVLLRSSQEPPGPGSKKRLDEAMKRLGLTAAGRTTRPRGGSG